MQVNMGERMLRLVIFMAFAMFPLSALAQSCSFSVSNMNFGLVDTLSGSQTNTTATINMNCSGICRSAHPDLCASCGRHRRRVVGDGPPDV
ncbi:spore coat protein U domain-containing protein [Mesorhizobium sp. M7A.F.Ca.US.002.01.1.1]|uniref:spore coat protein U domain-containing protein n=1 Tax=Mesorhizobium sp. M7A.F.Ca.US.002.01.1.1 TaxID=2496700 RepID=UPI0032AF1E3F